MFHLSLYKCTSDSIWLCCGLLLCVRLTPLGTVVINSTALSLMRLYGSPQPGPSFSSIFRTTKKETVVIGNVRWEKICNYTRRRCTTYREAAAQLPLLSRLRVCALCVDCDEIRTHTHTTGWLNNFAGDWLWAKKKKWELFIIIIIRSFVHFSLSSVWLPAARQTKQTRLYIEPGLLITIQGVRHDIYTHTMCVCVCICRVMMRQRTL